MAARREMSRDGPDGDETPGWWLLRAGGFHGPGNGAQQRTLVPSNGRQGKRKPTGPAAKVNEQTLAARAQRVRGCYIRHTYDETRMAHMDPVPQAVSRDKRR